MRQSTATSQKLEDVIGSSDDCHVYRRSAWSETLLHPLIYTSDRSY